jgi:hypothetical protein
MRAQLTKTPSKIDEKRAFFDQKRAFLGQKEGKNGDLQLLIG